MKQSRKILAFVLCIVMGISCLSIPTALNVKAKAEIPVDEKKDIKILILGNSYGRDAYEYLYKVFQSSGKYNNVTVGDLFQSGQSLQGHVASLIYALGGTQSATEDVDPVIDETTLKGFSVNNQIQYHYYKHTGNNRIPYTYATNLTANFSDIIIEENWDLITIQEAPKFMGNNQQYKINAELLTAINSVIGAVTEKEYTLNNTYIDVLTDYIKVKASQAKIYWHETFANINSDYYNKYSNVEADGVNLDNQAKMYYGQSQFVKNVVNPYVEDGTLAGIIPAGTAFQYLYEATGKSSAFYRDNIHLSDKGRYIADLAWYTAISGNPVTDVTNNFIPNFGVYELKSTIEKAVNYANGRISNGKFNPPRYVVNDGVAELYGIEKYTVTSETRAADMVNYNIDFYEDFDLGNTFKSSLTNQAITLRTGGDYIDSGFSRSGNYAFFGVKKQTNDDSTVSYYIEDAYSEAVPAGNEIANLSFITHIPAHDATNTVVYFNYTDEKNWKRYNIANGYMETSVNGTVTKVYASQIKDSSVGLSTLEGAYSSVSPLMKYCNIMVEMKYAVENGAGYYYIYRTSYDNADTYNPTNIATDVWKLKVSDNVTASTGMISTLRFGYADTASRERDVCLDQVEAQYYSAEKAAALIADISAVASNDTVHLTDKDNIYALYDRYEEFSAKGLGELITNYSDLLLVKGVVDYLVENGIDQFSKTELTDFNNEIAQIGAIHLGKYAKIQDLYNRYLTYLDMGVADSISNKDILIKAKENVEWLKSKGYYYYDDFNASGIQGGTVNFENLNPYIEEEAAEIFDALVAAGNTTTKDSTGNISVKGSDGGSMVKLADANKQATAYIETGVIHFNSASGYYSTQWLPYQNASARYSAVHGLKADAYDGQPIYKASFDYNVNNWLETSMTMIVTEYADENNWNGFSIGGQNIYKYAKRTTVDSETGKEKISSGDFKPQLIKGEDETKWVTGYSKWANITMEYKKADETYSSSDYYYFTIRNKDTSDDNNASHGSYNVAYLIVPASQPLTNLYFAAPCSDKSGIDNVIIYANDEVGPKNLGASILKHADTKSQKFAFRASYASLKNAMIIQGVTGEITYGVKYLGKYETNLESLLANTSTETITRKASGVSELPDDVSIVINNGSNAPGNRISVVFFATYTTEQGTKTVYSKNSSYDSNMSNLWKTDNGIASKSLTGVTKSILNGVVFNYQPTNVADSVYQAAFKTALSEYNTAKGTNYTSAVISAVTHSANKAAAVAALETAGYKGVDYHTLLNDLYVAMCKQIWPES